MDVENGKPFHPQAGEQQFFFPGCCSFSRGSFRGLLMVGIVGSLGWRQFGRVEKVRLGERTARKGQSTCILG